MPAREALASFESRLAGAEQAKLDEQVVSTSVSYTPCQNLKRVLGSE